MRGSRPGRQLANQVAIPAPDNQSLFGCWPGRQQIPASGIENQTSRKPAWFRRPFCSHQPNRPSKCEDRYSSIFLWTRRKDCHACCRRLERRLYLSSPILSACTSSQPFENHQNLIKRSIKPSNYYIDISLYIIADLTKQVLDWMMGHVKVPDLTVMSDSSGNTPLHLVSSVDDGAAIAKRLLSVTAEGWFQYLSVSCSIKY